MCSDGYQAYTGGFINKTLNAGATDSDILKETAGAIKTPPNIVDLPSDRVLPRGKTIFGNTRDVMHKVSKNNNADWSIQDGQLVVLPKNKVLPDNEGFVLAQETGMINSPEKTDNVLEITCLCNPLLKIGGLVRIKSIILQYNGDYKIIELKHAGDLMGDSWYSKIICENGVFTGVK